jgi:hypothetical protein
MKLSIPAHYQLGNPLQQGRRPCAYPEIKCIEFQVNRFDSYWEILIILKQYPKFLCAIPKQGLC